MKQWRISKHYAVNCTKPTRTMRTVSDLIGLSYRLTLNVVRPAIASITGSRSYAPGTASLFVKVLTIYGGWNQIMTSTFPSRYSKHVMNQVTGRCMYCSGSAVDMMRGKIDCTWCKGPVGMWALPPSGYIPKEEGALDPCTTTGTTSSPTPSPPVEVERGEEVFNKEAYDKFMRGL